LALGARVHRAACHHALSITVKRLLVLIALFAASSAKADEWWAWTMLEVWHHQPWTAGVFLVNRLDFDDGDIVQMISPRVKYEALPWLDLGLNLSLLSIENTATGDRYLQARPEIEATPKFDLTEHLKLECRNRMEWRDNEGEEFTEHRSRHRLQLGWTLPDPVGPLTRVFVSNEWLIDLHKHEWSENRFVPAGFTFKVSGHTDLDLFYMLLSHHVQSEWQTEQVIGTYLRVRF